MCQKEQAILDGVSQYSRPEPAPPSPSQTHRIIHFTLKRMENACIPFARSSTISPEHQETAKTKNCRQKAHGPRLYPFYANYLK